MKSIITTSKAPAAVGPYSQAVKTNDLIFTAGQLGIDPDTGEFVSQDVIHQTRQAMHNIQAVLQAAGSDLDQIVKTTIFVVDLSAFQDVNRVYGEFFPTDPPARSTVQVAALPLGGLVEIETIALAE